MKKFTLVLPFLLLCACSQPPQKAEEKKAPPAEPVTGRVALQRMFVAGRAWTADIEILRLNSIYLPEVKAERGKAAAWEVVFVSRQRAKSRSYTYSVIESAGNLHRGVFAGLEESWSGPRGIAKPFLMAAVKTDSDAVYEAAVKKAAAYEKKNPGKVISFLLEATSKFPDPAWRVIWGESAGTSNYSILIDASTGLYLETMR